VPAYREGLNLETGKVITNPLARFTSQEKGLLVKENGTGEKKNVRWNLQKKKAAMHIL